MALVAELKDVMDSGGINHPLLRVSNYKPGSDSEYNMLFELNQRNFNLHMNESRVVTALSMIVLEHQVAFLRKYTHLVTDEEYWSLLRTNWLLQEDKRRNLADWIAAMSCERGCTASFMEPLELLRFCQLPEVLTVYRGYHPGSGWDGLSWSMSPEVAKGHAKAKSWQYVMKGVVRRDFAIGYINAREQYEIALPSLGLVTPWDGARNE